MDYLDDLILRSGTSAYCLFASSDDPDMRYLTHFVTNDPVPVIKKRGEKPIMILPIMEADRAERESIAQCITRQQAGYQEIIATEKDPFNITASLIERCSGGAVIVPPQFPLALARALEKKIPVLLDEHSTISQMRSQKTSDEISHISVVQNATEEAMEHGINLIRGSTIRNGLLWHGEKPLTSELIRYTIHSILLSRGCVAKDTIVSCGEETAMPHCTGEGQLKAHQPIVIDLFPKSETSGYHADMTRTVSKGEPSGRVCELYEAVRDAEILGESLISAGVSGAECYQKVRDYFDDQGFKTDTEGFIHSLGHGIGLEVHEKPSLSPAGEELKEGHVVTVEPGLYYRGVGGVRIENMGVVTRSGFERLTNFPVEMIF
ncbi:MAG TPA: Xaa-Pro peptidase family protein [Methanospirillum sp.]|uniref:M24 family metallopeptidase n=1 Tax=Methanospirillum sp. TaxID=45200 RepID=UPI002C1D195C|nr:Xaa-Pro peptidase family protein [Methanospirillum sp.]HWQ63610.1 Xaa-Pro peptidase family protein [Methanospirillum sp.]